MSLNAEIINLKSQATRKARRLILFQKSNSIIRNYAKANSMLSKIFPHDIHYFNAYDANIYNTPSGGNIEKTAINLK